MTQPTLTVNTDGGARGNPGPAAAAAVFQNGSQVIDQASHFLGTATNNQAEYSAVILALNHLLKSPQLLQDYSRINFILDSELVVKQLNGLYKIKNPDLRQLALQVNSLVSKLSQPVVFSHVKRHLNKLPDQLLNQVLDDHS